MADRLHHERLYRGAADVERLGDVRLTLCGTGALGSQLADTLVRQGIRRLRVIDRDRVEEHNIGTQLYGEGDVGACKVHVLQTMLFRAVGVEIEAVHKELTDRNAGKLLKASDIVIDTFDNSASRGLVQSFCRASATDGLHVGLFAGYGEVIWDQSYRVPSDVDGDLCDYPLARNLVMLTAAAAAETLVRAVLTGARDSWSLTLSDFQIRVLEPAIGPET